MYKISVYKSTDTKPFLICFGRIISSETSEIIVIKYDDCVISIEDWSYYEINYKE